MTCQTWDKVGRETTAYCEFGITNADRIGASLSCILHGQMYIPVHSCTVAVQCLMQIRTEAGLRS